jgi:hypothetical protein
MEKWTAQRKLKEELRLRPPHHIPQGLSWGPGTLSFYQHDSVCPPAGADLLPLQAQAAAPGLRCALPHVCW